MVIGDELGGSYVPKTTFTLTTYRKRPDLLRSKRDHVGHQRIQQQAFKAA